jgi:hypothetical protein
MPKKSRPKGRRRNRDDHDGLSTDDDDDHDNASRGGVSAADDLSADYLSESHTIDAGSQGHGSTLASLDDDLEWNMHDGADDDDYHRAGGAGGGDDAAALAAQRRRQQKLATILGSVVDFPQEKRSARREQSLRSWFKALTQYATDPPYETVQRYQDGLVEACCQHVLYRGASSPAEQYAACRVVEALGVLTESSHDLYERVSKRLVRTVQSTHRATPVRSAALRALGMIVLCGGDEMDDYVTESVMELCETVVTTPDYRGQSVTPPVLQAAAFQVWTVLATTIHEWYVSGKDDGTTGRGLPLFPAILRCLEDESTSEAALQLKEAAGQAVVYIHDARLRLGADESQAENTTDVQYKPGSWEHTDYEDVMEDITQVVYQLAHASGHYMSKKAKKEQRSVFRDYLTMLQDDESPVHVVQFRGGSLELGTWKDVITLEYMKRCLQGGFQIQLLTNPTVQAMLGANGSALRGGRGGGGYSQLEKRLLLSKTSEAAKAKDVDRHKGRDKRTNIKNHFLTADGEDL